MNYFSEYRKDGYIYTVDMIRLKTYLSYSQYHKFSNYLCSLNLKFFHSRAGFGKYTDNYKSDKLWIGMCGHKMDTWNRKCLISMEFNPNKCTENDFNIIYYLLKMYPWSVCRFDLAVDIATNINNLCIKSILKKHYMIFYNDYNDKTYYFGKGDGHTKIYNKKIESNLDYELTRYEVTKTCDFELGSDIPFIKFNFLQLFFNPYYSNESGSTYNAILFALNSGYPFRDLSRDYRDKIKHDYFGSPELSDEAANCALHNCCCKLIRLI